MDENTQDADPAPSKAALRLAGKGARELAERTQTPLVTYQDGQVRKEMVPRETPDKTH